MVVDLNLAAVVHNNDDPLGNNVTDFKTSFIPISNTMTKSKPILILLISLNTIVLLGQVFPEGAPPFAQIVNILFLLSSLIFFIWLFKRMKE